MPASAPPQTHFCATAAAFFHYNFADPNQAIHFLKNIMLAGGLLQIVAFAAVR
jgi:putative oxidoreductase